MRFHLLARRMILAPALALALAAVITACSSSSSSSSSASHTSSATPAAVSTTSASSEIKTNWEAFCSGATPASKKMALLQNGRKYTTLIQAQAGSGLAKSASATVTAVHVISPMQAAVTYDIDIGKPALSNQTGTAVHQDGT